MINEKLEVEKYLAGENISKSECTFRMCTLMAKYYRDQNYSPVEIRKKIFDWGKKYGVYITHNVNDIIRMVIAKNEPLHIKDVYVNEDDIEEINVRFSRKNTKLCALAILLLAKTYGGESGILAFSQADFARWVGILQPNVSTEFDELEFFDYIEKIRLDEDATFVWNGRVVGKNVRYRVKVPYTNSGEYKLEDNNVRELYSKVFQKKK